MNQAKMTIFKLAHSNFIKIKPCVVASNPIAVKVSFSHTSHIHNNQHETAKAM